MATVFVTDDETIGMKKVKGVTATPSKRGELEKSQQTVPITPSLKPSISHTSTSPLTSTNGPRRMHMQLERTEIPVTMDLIDGDTGRGCRRHIQVCPMEHRDEEEHHP
jgi:hypothetical protein